MHKDADKFVPGAIWTDGFGEFELLVDGLTDGGRQRLAVRVLRDNEIHRAGWVEPHGHWRFVRWLAEPERPGEALLLMAAASLLARRGAR